MRPTLPPAARHTSATARTCLRRTALLAAGAPALLAGCGGVAAESVDRVRARATALVDEVRSAVEEAKERSAAQTGDVERRAPAGGRQIRTDTGQPFDYEQYRATLEQTVALLEQCWSSALPQRFGAALQADCFAGAWARYVQDQRLLDAGDLDEATFAVFSGRDLPDTPYSDPAAHGSGFERTRAFSDGFKGDPRACSPAARADC